MPAIPELVAKMVAYCKQHGGVGLAAPQVGINKSLAVVLTQKDKILEMINPAIVKWSGRDLLGNEGCLSIPPSLANQAKVWRSEHIHVACGNETNPYARQVTEHAGWVARVIQHEVDHLNPEGQVYFIDRTGPVAKGQVLRKYLKFRRQMEAAHV